MGTIRLGNALVEERAMRPEIIPYAPVMLALVILGGIGLAIGSSPVLG